MVATPYTTLHPISDIDILPPYRLSFLHLCTHSTPNTTHSTAYEHHEFVTDSNLLTQWRKKYNPQSFSLYIGAKRIMWCIFGAIASGVC